MIIQLTSLAVKSILLDVEGTTTPMEFVYDVLFPFARKNVKEYLQRNFSSGEVEKVVNMLRKEHENDVARWAEPPFWDTSSKENEVRSIGNYLLWMMDKDKKSTALKRLQGKIWEEGYERNELKGEVYPDVLPAFQRWRKENLELRIYSSGSVLAQKLLFSHSNAGDLTPYLQGYFDTNIGMKNAPDSYRRISKEMKLNSPEIVFLSDNVVELDAAKKTGMKTLLCVRPTDAYKPAPLSDHRIITSFDEIQ